MPTPTPGQKTIPIGDWKRFLRMADWFERTIEQGAGVLSPAYGEAMIVKTPGGGIPAREDTDISSATCTRCVEAESGTPGEKVLHDTEEELLVYNLNTTAVPGNSFVNTALSPKGTRFYAQEPGVEWKFGKLDGDLAAGGTATMSVWSGSPLADTGDNLTVETPLLTSGTIPATTWVWAQQHSNGGWYVLGAAC